LLLLLLSTTRGRAVPLLPQNKGSATRPLPQVAVKTACRLPLGLHLLSRYVGILPLLRSHKGLLQAPHNFCCAFAVHCDTDQDAIAGVG
jgi:hypothetical protein